MGNKSNPEDIFRVKTFMQAMDWFNLTPDEKERFLSDKRLSQAEKKILSASFLLRKGEYLQIIQDISNLKTPNSLVEAMKHFVLGVTFNAQSNHTGGIYHLNLARDIFHQQQLIHWEFQCLVQCFYCYLNLKKSQELALVLDDLLSMNDLRSRDLFSLYRCRFNYFVYIGEFSKAKFEQSRIEKIKNEMHPSQYINYLVDKFIFHLKTDRFDYCENDLKEMQKFRDYRLTESFYFMQSLFEHFKNRKPIYLYDEMFKDKPLLFHQLKVIQGLESGDNELAKDSWNKLNGLNSHVYKNFLDYQGDKCLFSLCLNLYKNEERDISEYMKLDLNPNEKKLIMFLSKVSRPISKEELFEIIWGEKIKEKSDLSRLLTLVSRLKAKTGIEIKSSKGSYSLGPIQLQNKKCS